MTSFVRGVVVRWLAAEGAAWLLFFAFAIALQWFNGAFEYEFGGHSDEPAHYITGLMVRDFLVSPSQWGHPIQFAESYYVHYPKVAIGHWPPFFYVLLAGWMLLFSASRISMMLFMAVLTALLAYVLYRFLREQFGPLVATGMGLLLIALPLMQVNSGMLMMEVPIALLMLGAVLSFGRYLETGRWQSALAFGVLASLAILTKGTGLVLAVVPPLGVLFSRRFGRLATFSFWMPAVLVLVLCAPWYWLTLGMVTNAWDSGGKPSIAYTQMAVEFFSSELVYLVGVPLFVLAIVGFFGRVVKPFWSGGAEGRWATLGAYLVGLWVFLCGVPCSPEDRFVVLAAPVLVAFLTAGADCLFRLPLLARLSPRLSQALLVLGVLATFGIDTFTLANLPCGGFKRVAEDLLATPAYQRSVFLVCSDANGEGMFISEVATRDARPGHTVLRGSKVLSTSHWNGQDYLPFFHNSQEVMGYLDNLPVGIVVMDTSAPADQHHEQVLEAIEGNPSQWELIGSYPRRQRKGERPDSLRIYRLVGHETRSVGLIRLDMGNMLGRTIEVQPY